MKFMIFNSGSKVGKSKLIAVAATLAAFAITPGIAWAQSTQGETITQAFREALPNVPGKSLVGLVVSYAPGGKSPPHLHPKTGFVTGYVLSGAIRSQLDGGKVEVFQAGESWFEKPGTHHDISENASTTEPATLLAIFVVDSNDTELTTPQRR